MNKIKFISLFLIVSALLLSLSACSSNSNFRDDVDVADIQAEIEKLIPVESGYKVLSADYLKYNFTSSDNIESYKIVQSVKNEDINEFGIFKVNKDNIDTVRAVIEDYVKVQKDTNISFVNTYAPKEVSKLENASVKVFGNYIVYLILDSSVQKSVYDSVENLLTE